MSGTEIESRYLAIRILILMLMSILLITSIVKYQNQIAKHGKLDASKPTRNGFRSSSQEDAKAD